MLRQFSIDRIQAFLYHFYYIFFQVVQQSLRINTIITDTLLKICIESYGSVFHLILTKGLWLNKHKVHNAT